MQESWTETQGYAGQGAEGGGRHLKRGRLNVGLSERWITAIAGGAMVAWGLQRRDGPGITIAALGGMLVARGATGHCPAYQALGVNTSSGARENTAVPYELGIRVDRAITINRPASELYQFWRQFENLPRFMKHVHAVRQLEGNRSHWVARAPLYRKVEWDAEVINEEENRLIGWRSLPGSQVDSAGSVHFIQLPGDLGTEVRVSMQYNPPLGTVGKWLARIAGEDPVHTVLEDLHRFKQLMETGEIATTEGQTSGRRQLDESSQRLSGRSRSYRGAKPFDTEDEVETGSEMSFPASDPPTYMSTGEDRTY
jgi:uncharacterized membrane protein